MCLEGCLILCYSSVLVGVSFLEHSLYLHIYRLSSNMSCVTRWQRLSMVSMRSQLRWTTRSHSQWSTGRTRHCFLVILDLSASDCLVTCIASSETFSFSTVISLALYFSSFCLNLFDHLTSVFLTCCRYCCLNLNKLVIMPFCFFLFNCLHICKLWCADNFKMC